MKTLLLFLWLLSVTAVTGTTFMFYDGSTTVTNYDPYTGTIGGLVLLPLASAPFDLTNSAAAMGQNSTNNMLAISNVISARFANMVPVAGTNMTGALTNNSGYYGASFTTNNIVSQSVNYSVLNSDSIVLISGAHTATLPTAVGIPGRTFTIKCTSSGTNGILTTLSQTIDGATKWTNTAINKFTTVISDGANWRVIGQN